MVALIDNYDSFSYNLYQLIGKFRTDIRVFRNDEITVPELEALKPEAVILSPGPGRPEEAGICIETVRVLGGKVPVLGVCLGHQAICAAYGGVISYAGRLMHGKTSRLVKISDSRLFAGLEEPVTVARYHSLALQRESLPECLKVTAEAQDGEIMAVRHREYKVYGLQFHPESILTAQGETILKNFFENGGKCND